MAGFSGNRGVPQSYSPYNSGFTSFTSAPRPAPVSTGFTPPPGATGQSLFAPPPAAMTARGNVTNALMNLGGGGFAPPPSNLFAAPPAPGAMPPMGAAPAMAPRPAFNAQFSPGAIANPGGNAMRGRGY